MKTSHVSLAQLEVLLAIAETGSFTAAGELLGLTQSAVSHGISSLEATLGVKLLERNRSGAFLTEVGARILEEARATIAQADQLQQVAADFRGLNRGTLRLGAFPSVATQIFPDALKKFQEMYPQVETVLVEGTDDEVKEWLRRREIEIGVVTSPCDEFELFPFATDEMCVVVPASHQLARCTRISLQQLADESFIMSAGGCEPLIRSTFDSVGLAPNVKFTFRDIGTIFAFVRIGLGVTIVPSLSINVSLDGVHIIPLEPIVERHIALAVRSGHSLSPIETQFVKHMERHSPNGN